MTSAGKIERFDAVAGSYGLIAMGFQQVVEELHIELIVLHDQDRLGFGIHAQVSGAVRANPSAQ